MGTGAWVLVVAVALAGLTAVLYNQLVQLRNRYRNAFAQIDVQLERRYDLIPNLVAVAKGYLEHERETLEAVTQARNQALAAVRRAADRPGDPSRMKALAGAEQVLEGSLGRLLATAEAYPELKADANLRELSEELASTENRVAFARQAFNDAAMHYNTARESFPQALIAGPLGFGPVAMLELQQGAARQAPTVQL